LRTSVHHDLVQPQWTGAVFSRLHATRATHMVQPCRTGASDGRRFTSTFSCPPPFFLSFFLWQIRFFALPIFLFYVGPLSFVGLLWFYRLFCFGFFSSILRVSFGISSRFSTWGAGFCISTAYRSTPAGVMRFHRGGLTVRPMRRTR
jgi:hypothetical protein